MRLWCTSKAVLAKSHPEGPQENTELKCEQCDFVTSKNSKLLVHIKNTHKRNNYLWCGECDYAGSQKDRLPGSSHEDCTQGATKQSQWDKIMAEELERGEF